MSADGQVRHPRNRLGTLCTLLALCGALGAGNGFGAEEGEAGEGAEVPVPRIRKFTNDELRKLVLPIALYPDALLAQILPASAFPLQIVLACRHLQSAKDPAQPPPGCDWDSSVVALLNYPAVLRRLNDDLEWTERLGWAVSAQMSELSATIQQVRAEAQAAGNLVSDKKQVVVQEQEVIRIVPAEPTVIYLPVYRPELVFDRFAQGSFLISYGLGLPWGNWLLNELDWRHHCIRIHYHYRPWHSYSGLHGGWYRHPRPYFWRPPHRPYPGWYLRNPVSPPVRPPHPGGRPPVQSPHPGTRPGLQTPHPGSGTRPGGQSPHPGTRPGGSSPHPGTRPPPGSGGRPPGSHAPRPSAPPATKPRPPRGAAPPSGRPHTGRTPAHRLEGLGGTGQQTIREAHRGQSSRAPAHSARPPASQQGRVPYRAPRAGAPGFLNPGEGRGAGRASQRGSSSRGMRSGRRHSDAAIEPGQDRLALPMLESLRPSPGAEGEPMPTLKQTRVSMQSWAILAALAAVAPAPGVPAEHPQGVSAQQVFPTPEAALQALLEGFRSNSDEALLEVLGQQHRDLVVQDDKESATRIRTQLANLAQEHHRILVEEDRAVVRLGAKDWPYPIPLVKGGGGWTFDTAAGKEEILNRRIGRNELSAISFLQAYGEAQRVYAAKDRTGDQVLKYAQNLVSTPGCQDGLYWDSVDQEGEEPSPLAGVFGDGQGEDGEDFRASGGVDVPYHGYYFKILTRQGAHAPNGKYDYVINGNMIAGFAIVAWPANYGSSGVMTFIASHQGILYQKDWGAQTDKTARKMERYDPDQSWTAVSFEDL